MTDRTKRCVSLRKSGEKATKSGESPGKHWVVGDDISRDTPERSGSVSKLYHDIRTQLYVIIGFVELMLDEVPGKINDEQRRNLQDILKSGERLLELLNDIAKQSESEPSTPGNGETRGEL